MANIMFNKESAREVGKNLFYWFNGVLEGESDHDSFSNLDEKIVVKNVKEAGVFIFECIYTDEEKRLWDRAASLISLSIGYQRLSTINWEKDDINAEICNFYDYSHALNIKRAEYFATWFQSILESVHEYFQTQLKQLQDEDYRIHEIFEKMFAKEEV